MQHLADRTLLHAVVAPGVLRRVVDKPARRHVAPWRVAPEGADGVSKAYAAAADSLHCRQNVLHAIDDNGSCELRPEGRLHAQRTRQIPHDRVLIRVLLE
eukprot:5363065-Prymnesium_polylepis.2